MADEENQENIQPIQTIDGADSTAQSAEDMSSLGPVSKGVADQVVQPQEPAVPPAPAPHEEPLKLSDLLNNPDTATPDSKPQKLSELLKNAEGDRPNFALAKTTRELAPEWMGIGNKELTPGERLWVRSQPEFKIMDAFGVGWKETMDANMYLNPDTIKDIKKIGAWDGIAQGDMIATNSISDMMTTTARNIYEEARKTYFTPLVLGGAALLNLGVTAISAPFEGAVSAAAEGGKQLEAKGIGTGTELPAAVEWLGTTAEGMGAVSYGVPRTVVRGVSNGALISEEVFSGLKEPTPAEARKMADASKALGEAAVTEAPKTVHDIARLEDPIIFQAYDTHLRRREVLRDQYAKLRDERNAALEDKAPHDDEIASLREKIDEANPRKTKIYQKRIEDLSAQNNLWKEEQRKIETADMQAVKEKLLEIDSRIQDIGRTGRIAKAYREAEKQVPPIAELHIEKVGEQPEPAPEAPHELTPEALQSMEQHRAAIAEGVSKKLIAAGRPAEEANAAAQLVAEHYVARSERFEGKAGTPVEMYLRDSPEIKAGKTKKIRELAQEEKGTTLEQKSRGKIRLATEDSRALITLLKEANASTFIHETGHHWLDELFRDSIHKDAPDMLKKDAATVKDWLGITEGGEITRRQHEKFARGFERYLMEGTAPSKTLAKVFQQFKDWLTKIYQTVNRLKSPINDDIRDVMDRLLATNPEKTVIAAERAETVAPPAEPVPGMGAAPEAAVSGSSVIEEPIAKKPDMAKPESPSSEMQPESELMDKAGNIRLENLTTNNDVRDVMRQAARDSNDFLDARHGYVSDAEVASLADAMGVEAKKLNIEKLRKMSVDDGIPLAVRIRAGRKMLLESSESVLTAMNKAATTGDNTDILAFAEARNRHLMIAETVSSVTEEWGRAGRAFRDISKETMNDAAAVTELFQSMTGKTAPEMLEIARQGAVLDTPQAVSKFMQDSKKVSFWDMLTEYRINAMLSGAITHVKNTIGNSFVAVNSVAETGATSLVGKLLGSKERIQMGEAKARWFGIFQGAEDGFISAAKILKNEGATKGPHTVERYAPKIPGKMGEIVRIPTRLLSAEDEFFKAIAYRQEINALSYRLAFKEGLSGDFFAQRVAELTQNPSEEMMKSAVKNAQYQTFTNPLGPTGRSLQNLANSNVLLKNVIPFIRTPVNIIKYAAERTPFGALSKEIRADLSGVNGEVARDSRIAKMAIGTSLSVLALKYQLQGTITGSGPSNVRDRALLMDQGWRPYSIKIGDSYYSYQWLDPVATLIGTPVDVAEIVSRGVHDEESLSKIIGMTVASISKNLISKASLRGMSDFVQTAADPDRYGENFLKAFAASFVPSFIAQPVAASDGVLREVNSIVDSVKSKLPFLREGLIGKRDVWGELIPSGDRLGPDIISPVYISKIKNDPVSKVLVELGFYPTPASKKILGVKLTERQYDEYVRISGKMMRQRLEKFIGQPSFSFSLPGQKIDTMKGIIDHSRALARQAVMMQWSGTADDIVRKANDLKHAMLTGNKK